MTRRLCFYCRLGLSAYRGQVDDFTGRILELEEQYDTLSGKYDYMTKIARSYMVERDSLKEQLETARDWYRDHVSENGHYDEAMWGDPFAISPQLRAALTSNPAKGPDA